jgi:hypothetical protein
MAPRTRTRSLNEDKGFRWRFGQVAGGFPVWTERSSVSDQTGPGDCAPFDLYKQTIEGGKLNLPEGGYFGGGMANYRCDFFDFPSTFGHRSIPDSPSDVDIATQLAARTNPSRPYVDVAANILELGDITDLIRSRGLDIFSKIFKYKAYRNRYGYKKALAVFGDINLLYQFGIAPLVGDLVKLCNFQDAVNRRIKQVEKLRSARGYRRTIDFGTYSTSDTTYEVMQSADRFVQTFCHWKTVQNVRGHIRWVTDEDVKHLMSDDDMRALVRRAVVNLDLNAGALWEGIPWSWLIDWGTNIGTYFKATRNVIPAHVEGVHVIRHTQTEMVSDATATDTGVTLSPGKMSYETKSRHPSFVAPIAHFPFLDGNQMGILASLAITRT